MQLHPLILLAGIIFFFQACKKNINELKREVVKSDCGTAVVGNAMGASQLTSDQYLKSVLVHYYFNEGGGSYTEKKDKLVFEYTDSIPKIAKAYYSWSDYGFVVDWGGSFTSGNYVTSFTYGRNRIFRKTVIDTAANPGSIAGSYPADDVLFFNCFNQMGRIDVAPYNYPGPWSLYPVTTFGLRYDELGRYDQMYIYTYQSNPETGAQMGLISTGRYNFYYDNHDNIIKVETYFDSDPSDNIPSFLAYVTQFEYDNKPNPFRLLPYMQLFGSTDISMSGNIDNAFLGDPARILSRNNVVKSWYSRGGSSRPQTYAITYNSNGYPAKMICDSPNENSDETMTITYEYGDK